MSPTLDLTPVPNDENWNKWKGWRRCSICNKRCEKYNQIPLTRLHGCSTECLDQIRQLTGRGGQ